MILKWHTHEMPVPDGSLDALKHIIDNLPDYITQSTAIEDVPENTETCFVSLSNDRTAVTIKAISKDSYIFATSISFKNCALKSRHQGSVKQVRSLVFLAATLNYNSNEYYYSFYVEKLLI